MSTELYLAKRYLFHHRPGAWGWLIGWLATGSVALGVGALIITLAVMTGFRQDIQQKILGIQPHIVLSGMNEKMTPADPQIEKILSSDQNVEIWSPFVTGQVLIGFAGQSSGAVVKGIDPMKEPRVANLEKKLIRGSWSDLARVPSSTENKPLVILGAELARNLGAQTGDIVWMVTPGSMGLGALSIPKAHLFKVGGIVQSGLFDYDTTLAYTNISSAQNLFGLSSNISGVGVRVKNPDSSEQIAQELQTKFAGACWARSWLSLNKNLFSALKLEKTVMFLILTLITLVASVMVVSNLLLSISQKTKEIGILRAMGASGSAIRKIFLFQGALMGFLGTVLGILWGIGVSLILAKTNWIRLPADVYYVDRLPIRIEAMDVALVAIVACVIVVIATLYPSDRATKLNPLEAIRAG